MGWEKTKCYLCDKPAEEWYIQGNLRIRCFNCNSFYSLSSHIQQFRLDENKNLITKDKNILSSKQKKNLLHYVQSNKDPEGKIPVKLFRRLY